MFNLRRSGSTLPYDACCVRGEEALVLGRQTENPARPDRAARWTPWSVWEKAGMESSPSTARPPARLKYQRASADTPPKSFLFREAPPGFEPGIKDLQSSALPLGHGAKNATGADSCGCRPQITRAGNRTRTGDPNLGKVVLYQLSYSRTRCGSQPRNIRGGGQWLFDAWNRVPRTPVTPYVVRPNALPSIGPGAPVPLRS